jgi:hypothetical protein
MAPLLALPGIICQVLENKVVEQSRKYLTAKSPKYRRSDDPPLRKFRNFFPGIKS